MSLQFYQILHIFSVLMLTGITFAVIGGAPAERRKLLLSLSGVFGLLALVAGIGLLHKLTLGFPVWAIIKIVCWLGLMALGGIAYRRRAQAPVWAVVTTILIFIAVWAVYLKPFHG